MFRDRCCSASLWRAHRQEILEHLVWPRFWCRSTTPFEDSQAKHLDMAKILMPLYHTTWGFTGTEHLYVARILILFRLIHISASLVTKILAFQKINENIMQLLICITLSTTFLLVKLLPVAYIPRSLERFVIHSFEIECSQSSLWNDLVGSFPICSQFALGWVLPTS